VQPCSRAAVQPCNRVSAKAGSVLYLGGGTRTRRSIEDEEQRRCDGEHQSVGCQRGRHGSTRTAAEARQPACLMGSLEPRRREGNARQGRAGQGKQGKQGQARAGRQGNKLCGTVLCAGTYGVHSSIAKVGVSRLHLFLLAAGSHQPPATSQAANHTSLPSMHASNCLHATCSEILRKECRFYSMPTTHRQCHSRGAASTLSVGAGVDVSV
jgi:hypothetical protein